MPGMFYSLKETAQRLDTSETEVKQLVKDGKLREFRDGANLLFKIDEVDALVDSLQNEAVDLGLDAIELEETPAEEPVVGLFEEAGELEEVAEVEETEELEATGPISDEDLFRLDEETPALEPMGEVEGTSELELAPEETPADASGFGEDDLLLLDGESAVAGDATSDSLADDMGDSSEEEISLAAESGVLAADSDITNMDTALTGEGVNVLGGSSSDFGVTEDSMAETAVGPAGSSAEASLEEIEDDVNLDSFGSGSGLLDLSLQADDTSLGGILDEIYTSEGGEVEAEGSDGAGLGDEGASFEDLTTETDRSVSAEEELPMPEPVAMMPAAVGAVYAEVPPDTQSNMLGILLFLPMLALLYAAIVTVAGMGGINPGILSSIQGLIWPIVIGGMLISLGVFAASFMVGRERTEAPARVRKDKKAKAEKPGKEKKSKAEKPAKAAKGARAEKPAKEKKSFFGKKK